MSAPVPAPQSFRRNSPWLFRSLVLLLFAGIIFAAFQFFKPAADTATLLTLAREAYRGRDYAAAEQAAAQAFERDPQSATAGMLAARSAHALKRFEAALNYLDRISADDPKTYTAANAFAAEICRHQLLHLTRAEEYYRRALTTGPARTELHQELADLLCRCGQRDFAVPHVLACVRLGRPTDQLIVIARPSGTINDIAGLTRAVQRNDDDVNALVGLANQAYLNEDYTAAKSSLARALQLDKEHVAAQLLHAETLLELNQDDETLRWIAKVSEPVTEHGRYWRLLGELAERRDDRRGAIRCYWEALRRSPELRGVYPSLIQLLATTAPDVDTTSLKNTFQGIVALYEIQDRVWSNREPQAEDLVQLVEAYRDLGRDWEAFGWARLALTQFHNHHVLQKLARELRETTSQLPLVQTTHQSNVALELNLTTFPLPKLTPSQKSITNAPQITATNFRFEEQSTQAGLCFQYYHGSDDLTCRQMFTLTGGGVGVLDFDLDGFSETFFSQGRSWPIRDANPVEDGQLFQNLDGKTFRLVSPAAEILETGFGQGVSVGDFNADGFPDLYLAQIGTNQLWQNNGDGTFTNVSDTAGLKSSQWTTSCLIADLNGDRWPDLYDTNYLVGDDLFSRVCKHPDDSPALCQPYDFSGDSDRVLLNDGTGGFKDVTSTCFQQPPNGKGLGVLAWRQPQLSKLSILVANDTTPNFFFQATDETKEFRIVDNGFASGLACNSDGKAEGCMGIAIADVDQNGLFDVHITNFYNESNTLWLQRDQNYFQDVTREQGLHRSTLPHLGFGTQFLDANLDGRHELFVTNGHIDDLSKFNRPYEMPAQFFAWTGRQFHEVSADQLGGYFRQRWLGRAAAKIDWNRDGLCDLVVGHLHHPSALLTNQSPATGRPLTLRLVGTESSRDALGTTVRVRIGSQTWMQQLMADGGYQASNERLLIFGIGSADAIDELTIEWLSGTVQTFRDVKVPAELVCIEGRGLLNRASPD